MGEAAGLCCLTPLACERSVVLAIDERQVYRASARAPGHSRGHEHPARCDLQPAAPGDAIYSAATFSARAARRQRRQTALHKLLCRTQRPPAPLIPAPASVRARPALHSPPRRQVYYLGVLAVLEEVGAITRGGWIPASPLEQRAHLHGHAVRAGA